MVVTETVPVLYDRVRGTRIGNNNTRSSTLCKDKTHSKITPANKCNDHSKKCTGVAAEIIIGHTRAPTVVRVTISNDKKKVCAWEIISRRTYEKRYVRSSGSGDGRLSRDRGENAACAPAKPKIATIPKAVRRRRSYTRVRDKRRHRPFPNAKYDVPRYPRAKCLFICHFRSSSIPRQLARHSRPNNRPGSRIPAKSSNGATTVIRDPSNSTRAGLPAENVSRIISRRTGL